MYNDDMKTRIAEAIIAVKSASPTQEEVDRVAREQLSIARRTGRDTKDPMYPSDISIWREARYVAQCRTWCSYFATDLPDLRILDQLSESDFFDIDNPQPIRYGRSPRARNKLRGIAAEGRRIALGDRRKGQRIIAVKTGDGIFVGRINHVVRKLVSKGYSVHCDWGWTHPGVESSNFLSVYCA